MVPKPDAKAGENGVTKSFKSAGPPVIPKAGLENGVSLAGGENTEERAEQTRRALEFAGFRAIEDTEERARSALSGDMKYLDAAFFGKHEVLQDMLKNGGVRNKHCLDKQKLSARDLVEKGRNLARASEACDQKVVDDYEKCIALLDEHEVPYGADVVVTESTKKEQQNEFQETCALVSGIVGLVLVAMLIFFTLKEREGERPGDVIDFDL